MELTALAIVDGIVRITFASLLLAVGIWGYRRLRLPSIPWLLSYFVLSMLLSWPLTPLVKQVVNHVSTGSRPFGLRMSAGELIVTVSLLSNIIATCAQALVAWFILAELSYAYTREAGLRSVPRLLLVPRHHSQAVGSALLACVFIVPLLWLALAARA